MSSQTERTNDCEEISDHAKAANDRIDEIVSRTTVRDRKKIDRQRAVEQLFIDCPGKTQDWYAQTAGVSQAYVSYLWQRKNGKPRPDRHISKNDIDATAYRLLEVFSLHDIVESLCRAERSKTGKVQTDDNCTT